MSIGYRRSRPRTGNPWRSPLPALREPRRIFAAQASAEPRLRRRFLTLQAASPIPDAQTLLHRSAVFLELSAASACFLEALLELGVDKPGASGKPPAYFVSRVQETCGLDLSVVVRQAIKEFGKPPASTPRMPTLEATVRAARSLLEACPIVLLEAIAIENGLADVGHRCRLAFEALRAFVIRNGEREKERIRVIGRKYSAGELTVEEAAVLLDVTPSDVLFLLDENGYRRPLEVIALKDKERERILSSIRAERQQRNGEVHPSAERVYRETISSERLEEIDARPFIAR